MKLLKFSLALLIVGCSNTGVRNVDTQEQSSHSPAFKINERFSGTLYSTFQSHLPTFAKGKGCTYKSYAVDDLILNDRNEPVEVRIACRADGQWVTVWRDVGFSNPACLVEAEGDVFGVVVDWQTGELKVVRLNGSGTEVYTAPNTFPTSSKINCAMFNQELIILGTYGYAVTFSPSTLNFTIPRPVVAQNYKGTAYTQYPHLSVMGDSLFLGYNTLEFPDSFRYFDLVGYIVQEFGEAGLEKPLQRLKPPELLNLSTWVSDTYADAQRLYFATSANNFNSSVEYFKDVAEGLPNSLIVFGICNTALQCKIQNTGIPQDRAGNFVADGPDLLFVGGSVNTINVWRFDFTSEVFEMQKQIPHNVKCPYAWNFASFVETGHIIGQVTEVPSRCQPDQTDLETTYLSFEIELQ